VDRGEVQDAWAVGLWVRLFTAKKDAADGGGPQLDRLAAEIAERVALAALSVTGSPRTLALCAGCAIR
jgi:hypothetical protein